MNLESVLDPSSAGVFELISYVDGQSFKLQDDYSVVSDVFLVACLTLLVSRTIQCLVAFGGPTQSLKTYDTLLTIRQEVGLGAKSDTDDMIHLSQPKVQTYLEIKVGPCQGAISLDKIRSFHRHHNGCAKYNIEPLFLARWLKHMFRGLFAALGVGIAEIILMIRTYAQYNKSKKLLAFFVLLWVLVDSASSTSCNVESGTLAIACYAALLGGETVFFSESRNRHSHLMTTFYRDGLNLRIPIVIRFVPVKIHLNTPLQGTHVTPLRVVHSISACHLVIHVREVANQDSEDKTSGRITSGLEFVSPPVATQACTDGGISTVTLDNRPPAYPYKGPIQDLGKSGAFGSAQLGRFLGNLHRIWIREFSFEAPQHIQRLLVSRRYLQIYPLIFLAILDSEQGFTRFKERGRGSGRAVDCRLRSELVPGFQGFLAVGRHQHAEAELVSALTLLNIGLQAPYSGMAVEIND
ncbi:hypothetical protein GGX14DRAFT_397324 [Mycena pura]|uniref:Uncharacterized protein n=1 Tax=Mycena pura TaxID=153505 RepID=A0AAD6VCP8_9AGAR|nr:hypothetical protein GGX14DRAFT_397324 [Mycena pura]